MIVGFVGFGEAGSTLGGGLAASGVERIVAFDIATADPRLGPLLRERAQRTGTTLLDSPAALAAAADVIFSTVTSSSALDAAVAIAPSLEARHLYADLNSVSPALKQEMSASIPSPLPTPGETSRACRLRWGWAPCR